MAAPSLAALYDFESAFESAAQAVLQTSGINAFVSQQQAKLPIIYTGISFNVGAAYDELTILPIGGRAARDLQDYFRYSGGLELEISVTRDQAKDPDQAGALSFLGQVRGLARGAFMMSQWPFNDVNLPYYRVSNIRPDGTNNGFDVRRNVDLVTLRFAVDFAIQPTAWPAGFPPA